MRRVFIISVLALVPHIVWANDEVDIVAISCATSTEAQARIEITANAVIEQYQAPERIGNDVVLRIPYGKIEGDVVHTSCASQNIQITTKRIRHFLVIYVRAPAFGGGMQALRKGQNAIVLVINASTNGTSAATSTSSTKPSSKGWELDVIVIDAGHGGKDAGAKGVNGVYEKTVTLQLAKKLRDRIKATMPGTKVVMTRDDDTFVELYKRTEIANKADGKLFISIHCNSMPKIPHPAHGCETYILRPGRNEDAARVATRENASINLEDSKAKYQSLTEDQLIVATMAQRSFVRYSEAFAAGLQKKVPKATGLKNRGVSQAGFYVLVGASMPNVLFETAFLSNESDASVICSASGQNKLVSAMVEAITEYAAFYKQSLGN